MPDNQSVEIRLFGTMEMQNCGEHAQSLRARNQDLLLAALILRHGEPTDRTELATELWPPVRSENPAEIAAKSRRQTLLRQSLYHLVRSLEDQQGLSGRLVITADKIGFSMQGIWTDVEEFDHNCNVGDPVSLLKATQLYRGPLLAEKRFDVFTTKRREYERKYLKALVNLAHLSTLAGDYIQAETYALDALRTDHLHHEAWSVLIENLVSLGKYAAAWQQYRKYRVILHETTLNASHGSHIQSHEYTSESDLEYPVPATKIVALMDTLLERSAQPEGHTPHDYTAATTNIPAQNLQSLIGRTELIHQIRGLFRSGSRFLGLTGPSGIGKTSVAAQVGSGLCEHYPDGAWLVPLARATRPRHMITAVAEALGISIPGSHTSIAALAAHLELKSLLIVLDSCDHVATECARMVEELQEKCRYLHILTTSQRSLPITAAMAQHLIVPPLSVPTHATLHDAPKAAVESCDAGKFLLRCLGEQTMSETWSETMWSTLAEVCRRVDGIPLALELSAGQVQKSNDREHYRDEEGSIVTITDSLLEHFVLLTGSNHAAMPPGQIVRATIAWSDGLLRHDAESILLRRLAVFSGAFTMHAAESICSDAVLMSENVVELLECLVKMHLVIQTNLGIAPKAEPVYELAEAVQGYAIQRLIAEDEAQQLRARHSDYYVSFVSNVEADLFGREQAQAFERLAREYENVRAALEWCLALPDRTAQGLKLAAGLVRFWETRAHYIDDALHVYAELLARTSENDMTLVRADACYSAGRLAWYQSDFESSKKYLALALDIYRQLGLKLAIANGLRAQGIIASSEGHYDEASNLLQQSLDIVQRETDQDNALIRKRALITKDLGDVDFRRSKYGDAKLKYESVRPLLDSVGDRRALANVLTNLGHIAVKERRTKDARCLYLQSLDIEEDIKYSRGIAYVLDGFARLAAANMHWDRAVRLWSATEMICRATGAPLPADDREATENSQKSARKELGDQAFLDTQLDGRALPIHQIMALAREE